MAVNIKNLLLCNIFFIDDAVMLSRGPKPIINIKTESIKTILRYILRYIELQ